MSTQHLPETEAFRRVASRLRQLRTARGVTLETLAERSGVPLDTIGRIERLVSCPSLRTMERIAAGLGVDVATLLEAPTRTHEFGPAPGSGDLSAVLDLLSGRDAHDVARVRRIVTAYFEER
jgi:transcriptional regulator with XRE-family HTH domain